MVISVSRHHNTQLFHAVIPVLINAEASVPVDTMGKQDIDYSLYLVTDSTPAILGDRDVAEVVEQALRGGVTCVQYRDKTSDTAILISVARKLHEITKKYNVPLLINDRVDVALAVGCEGVHIGQDDMGR